MRFVATAECSAALRSVRENRAYCQAVKSEVLSGYLEVLDRENSAIHLRDISAADLVAEAFEMEFGIDENDLQGYQKDASVAHRSVSGVSAVVALAPGDVLVSDRSPVVHGDSLEAGANAGGSVYLILGYGSSAVADGLSISKVVLALDRLGRPALGIEGFYLDLTSVAMTGPADLSEEDQSQL